MGNRRNERRVAAAEKSPPKGITAQRLYNLASEFATPFQAAAILGYPENDLLAAMDDFAPLRRAWEAGQAAAQMKILRGQLAIAQDSEHPDQWKALQHLGRSYLDQGNQARNESGEAGVTLAQIAITAARAMSGELQDGEQDGEPRQISARIEPEVDSGIDSGIDNAEIVDIDFEVQE